MADLRQQGGTLARIEDVPEGTLREIAERIPAETLAALPGWELKLRLTEARILIGLAVEMEPGEAMKARTRADRILKAQPIDQHLAELGRLDGEMKAAAAAEDFQAAGKVFARLLEVQ